MPPDVALLLWLVLVLALFYFDPAKVPGTSAALWVPVVWMFIIASRLPSQWLGVRIGVQAQSAPQALEDGNSLDRTVYSVLIVLAIGILMSRSFKWGAFFARNRALTLLLLFSLVSAFWSDFPLVASKRWFRDLGNYLMVVVVLSDPLPLEAVRTFLRRLHYMVIPLSVVLVRYFPQIGKQYSPWTGLPEFIGVATSKNTLGVICMMSGIFFFWDTLTRWSERKKSRTKQILVLNVALIAMTVWLLYMSDSATSRVCLLLGCLIILIAHSNWGRRHPSSVKTLMPGCFLVYLILAFVFGLNGSLVSGVGRDSSFTGRTNIWQAVLSTNTNPLVGTGYESFWLGPRLDHVWAMAGPINEAHNGYLDVYLNLGYIGLFLVGGLLIVSYRRICRDLTHVSSLASLSAAFLTIALFYNVTEASFKPAFMCLTFLLGTVIVPGRPLLGASRNESSRSSAGAPESAEIHSLMAVSGCNPR
jgi:exopolysaccharide production protein ExoQ